MPEIRNKSGDLGPRSRVRSAHSNLAPRLSIAIASRSQCPSLPPCEFDSSFLSFAVRETPTVRTQFWQRVLNRTWSEERSRARARSPRKKGGGAGDDRRTPSSRYPSLFSSPLVRRLLSYSLSFARARARASFELTVRAGPFSRSAALSCAFRHAAFRSVSPVTDCRSGGRDNNNCQRSNISQASREEEKEHEGDGAGDGNGTGWLGE